MSHDFKLHENKPWLLQSDWNNDEMSAFLLLAKMCLRPDFTLQLQLRLTSQWFILSLGAM